MRPSPFNKNSGKPAAAAAKGKAAPRPPSNLGKAAAAAPAGKAKAKAVVVDSEVRGCCVVGNQAPAGLWQAGTLLLVCEAHTHGPAVHPVSPAVLMVLI